MTSYEHYINYDPLGGTFHYEDLLESLDSSGHIELILDDYLWGCREQIEDYAKEYDLSITYSRANPKKMVFAGGKEPLNKMREFIKILKEDMLQEEVRLNVLGKYSQMTTVFPEFILNFPGVKELLGKLEIEWDTNKGKVVLAGFRQKIMAFHDYMGKCEDYFHKEAFVRGVINTDPNIKIDFDYYSMPMDELTQILSVYL